MVLVLHQVPEMRLIRLRENTLQLYFSVRWMDTVEMKAAGCEDVVNVVNLTLVARYEWQF